MAKLIAKEADGLPGIETRYHREGESLVVERIQDVEPILEANKREQIENDYSGKRFRGTLHKVASVPMVIIEQWIKEGINPFDRNDAAKIRAKLNDPDNKNLRTRLGRI